MTLCAHRMPALVVLSYLIMTGFAAGMDFEIDGNIIRATGILNEGDTRLFFEGAGEDIQSDVDISYVMSFDSEGGSLLEGIALGEELRERRIVSHISGDSRCLSACAFAFLGGTFQYAVASGPMREMDWGAQLGFHGFSTDNDQVAAVSEIFSEARAMNAILVEYTQRMGGVDFAWVADALTAEPNDMVFVDSPRDLSALTITALGGPSTPPDDWDANLCSLLLREILMREDDDDIAYRLMGYNTLYSISEIISLIAVPVLTAHGAHSDAISGDSALELVIGSGFHLDDFRPILDARQRRLDRGAGLYYDYCISFRSSQRGFSALVDPLSGNIRHVVVLRRSPNPFENALVKLFRWNESLWIEPEMNWVAD